MSHTQRIASWVRGLRFEDIPPECVAKAKDQLLNILAAIFMSSGHPSSRAAITGMTLYGAGGPSTILGTNLTAVPDVAAYLNSFNAQLFEFEDWVNASHAGATVIPTALAVGEAARVDGRELLLAIVVGNEMAGRTGRAILDGAYVGNSLPNHQVDTALTAGRLLGLDVRQLQSAVSLSCFMAMECCPPGYITDAKALINSVPISQGIRSAQMALHGLVGNVDMIEHSAGYLATVSEEVDLDQLTNNLGKDWAISTLRSKPFPICGYNISAIECGLQIARENAFGPEEIKEVVVYAPASTLLAGTRYHSLQPDMYRQFAEGTATHMPLLFDVPYPLAVALTHRALLPVHFTREYIQDPALAALAKKITLKVDAQLNYAYYEDFRFGSRVVVRLRDGRRLEKLVEDMPGAPGNPFDVRSKFMSGVAPVLGEEGAARVAELIDDLERHGAEELGHALRAS